jgi:uncharacterized protein with NAD-binding domain and iron-sulfur cluster
MSTDEPVKTKIAILGGGLGAMTAAFMLTDRPELRDRFDITVYQMGWRLGGKGASGRNGERELRIEEHGPHIFMGFYRNAFWLMQKCYRELARPASAPLARWDDAFKPHGLLTLMEKKNGGWVQWPIRLPLFPGVQPGFPDDDEIPPIGGEVPTVWELIVRLLGWLGDTYDDLPAALRIVNLRSLLEHAVQVIEAVRAHAAFVPAAFDGLTLGWLDAFVRHLEVAVGAQLTLSDDVRRVWILLRLGAATARGLIADKVDQNGFESIDGSDLRAWLQNHGAPRAAAWSAPIQACYDLVFAYEQGDSAQPNLAAGTGLKGALRMLFDYQGALFWRMEAGMGDTIFAPFYQVLKQRGVKFNFFHRVESLGLGTSKDLIETIQLSRQATMKAGDYQPLIQVPVRGYAGTLDCWPAQPRAEQFIDGDKADFDKYRKDDIEVFESAWSPWPNLTPVTLQRGTDFDHVVLGISLGALPHLCKELIAQEPAWQTMVGTVKTAQTQSFQVWLKKNADQLGWDGPGLNCIAAYVEPFNAVIDMSQVMPYEPFSASQPVQSVAYIFGPLQDAATIPPPGPAPTFPAEQRARVKEAALEFLRTSVRPVWPGGTDAANPDGLDWDVLVDLAGQTGAARFDSQFWRANIDPSERYVLSVNGSTAARLRADASGFDNLVLAGDWTATGLSAGCAEAAVMSGMCAARKLAGHPWRIVGDASPLA